MWAGDMVSVLKYYIYGDENNQNFWIKPVLFDCIHDS